MKLWPFSKKATLSRREDGFMNLATGMGVSGIDKTTENIYVAPEPMQPQTANDLYAGNDIAALIVDVPIDEALRQGVKVRSEDADETKALTNWMAANCLTQQIGDAARWGRLQGAAGILLGTTDGGDRKEPLDLNTVKSLDFITVLDREEMTINTRRADGSVRDWFVTPQETGITSIVHSSRIVMFGGVKTPKRKKRDNSGYDYSALDRVHDVIAEFCATYNNAGTLLADGNQAVFKVAGLASMLARDAESVKNRFKLMQYARSVHRAMVVDAGDGVQPAEEFIRQTANFSGLPQMLQMFILRLSSAARIPATILMGQSPAGMNATGESDLRWFYNRLEGYQTNDLEPAFRRILDVLRASDAWEFSGDTEITFNWPELWGASENEKATARKTQAEADNINIQAGVLLPEEVTLNRFSTDDFNPSTTISREGLELRQQALDEEYEQFGSNIRASGQGTNQERSALGQGGQISDDPPATSDS